MRDMQCKCIVFNPGVSLEGGGKNMGAMSSFSVYNMYFSRRILYIFHHDVHSYSVMITYEKKNKINIFLINDGRHDEYYSTNVCHAD